MSDELSAVSEELRELNRRVGVMISLLLRATPADQAVPSLKQQLTVLADLGLRPRDIAAILGRTATYINKELSKMRKSKGAKAPKSRSAASMK
jgi:transposase-like protein